MWKCFKNRHSMDMVYKVRLPCPFLGPMGIPIYEGRTRYRNTMEKFDLMTANDKGFFVSGIVSPMDVLRDFGEDCSEWIDQAPKNFNAVNSHRSWNYGEMDEEFNSHLWHRLAIQFNKEWEPVPDPAEKEAALEFPEQAKLSLDYLASVDQMVQEIDAIFADSYLEAGVPARFRSTAREAGLAMPRFQHIAPHPSTEEAVDENPGLGTDDSNQQQTSKRGNTENPEAATKTPPEKEVPTTKTKTGRKVSKMDHQILKEMQQAIVGSSNSQKSQFRHREILMERCPNLYGEKNRPYIKVSSRESGNCVGDSWGTNTMRK